MLTENIIINAESGLHARPAGELVKLVKGFTGSRIMLSTAAKSVNVASMLSLLSLGLKKGTEVAVSVEGGDEEGALKSVIEFLKNFD